MLVKGLPFPIIPTKCIVDDETVRENIRSSVARGLPEVRLCNPHDRTISICAGGPSLNDTMWDVTGYVAALNGSHDHLIANGIVPNACAIMDPEPIMADLITPHDNVTYFIASMCSPEVFDKLKGQHVVIWHASNGPDCKISDLLNPESVVIGGGSTIGLRWLNLAYVCGFRDFHFHGLDSSFGESQHAYEQREEDRCIDVYGHKTLMPLTIQVTNFFEMMDRMNRPDVDPISVEIHGSGLLQYLAKLRGLAKFSKREVSNV